VVYFEVFAKGGRAGLLFCLFGSLLRFFRSLLLFVRSLLLLLPLLLCFFRSPLRFNKLSSKFVYICCLHF